MVKLENAPSWIARLMELVQEPTTLSVTAPGEFIAAANAVVKAQNGPDCVPFCELPEGHGF